MLLAGALQGLSLDSKSERYRLRLQTLSQRLRVLFGAVHYRIHTATGGWSHQSSAPRPTHDLSIGPLSGSDQLLDRHAATEQIWL